MCLRFIRSVWMGVYDDVCVCVWFLWSVAGADRDGEIDCIHVSEYE